MWVPSYSPKDFLSCYEDSLDWRRMLIGALLFFWIATGVHIIEGLIGDGPQFGEDLLRAINAGPFGLITSGEIGFSLLAKIVAVAGGFLAVALFLIYPLMRGGATEICLGKRSSIPELIAFGRFHAPWMIVVQAIGLGLSALILMPLAWAVQNLDESGAIMTLVVCGVLAIPVAVFLSPQAIFFPAHVVSGGVASEAMLRSCYYFVKAPTRFAFLATAKALSVVPMIALIWLTMHCLPDWLAWAIATPMIGFTASLGAATDVMIYVKLRHAVDGTPYALCVDPKREFLERASGMEQSVAIEKMNFPKPESEEASNA